jgi:hypothetical protein
MAGFRNCLIGTAVFGLFHAVAAASPIQVTWMGRCTTTPITLRSR